MKEFKKGQKIRVVTGGELEVVEKLGEGGQGIVYKVIYNGKELALKWYFGNKMKDNADNFYGNIQRNIKNGAPTRAFLWPLELTERSEGSFGYLMELRPPEYKDFSRFLLAKVKFGSISAVINAALCITNAFRALHARGDSYQDLNDGNIFINPRTGDVLICDNDNVAEYGYALGIAGKCRYMAPEVVKGDKKPDIHADRFSLAVVLYLLLFLNHPLEGKRTMCPCLTEELERKFYGTEPVFTWDPQNDTNRPVRGVHVNAIKFWPLYPKFVREKFEEAFSYDVMVGKSIENRVGEKTWEETFISLRDCLMVCSCGGETFVDTAQTSCRCINCNREIPRPLILKVKKYNVVLAAQKKVYACHTVYDSSDFREVKGEVIRNKIDQSVLGLRNESGISWTAEFPDGSSKVYETGQVIRLGKGLKINFGNKNIAEII